MDTHPNSLAPASTDTDHTLPEASASLQHTIALPDPDTGVLKNDLQGNDISIQQLSHTHHPKSLTSHKNAHENTAKQPVQHHIPTSALQSLTSSSTSTTATTSPPSSSAPSTHSTEPLSSEIPNYIRHRQDEEPNITRHDADADGDPVNKSQTKDVTSEPAVTATSATSSSSSTSNSTSISSEPITEKQPSNADITAKISDILSSSDLNSTSAKDIRKELQTHFRVDLSDRKLWINSEIMRLFRQTEEANENQNDNHEDDVDDDHTSASSSLLSQEEADRLLAEELAAEDARRPRRSAAADAARKSAKQRAFQDRMDALKVKRKAEAESDDGTRAKKKVAKPVWISEQLREIVGDDEMGRGDVVKKIWEYIKSNELQNPQNKREIICDQKLFNVFNRKSVTMFNMNKFLTSHVKNYD